jgi:amidophosphoribosyltransferase
MIDEIRHNCGLALVRLLKPIEHYAQAHGDPSWGLRRLFLLMEKQHNRGQDGAGVGVARFDMPPGRSFLNAFRSDRHNAIERVFDEALRDVLAIPPEELCVRSGASLKAACEYLGEVMIGHLRYGTHSGAGEQFCHPYVRPSTVPSRTLALAGNFNMTNATELFEQLVADGLHPVGDSDTQVILERLAYSLDREHDHLASTLGPEGLFCQLRGRELAERVSHDLDLQQVFERAAMGWDGGYAFVGLLGNGDAFACRDPAGIRPIFLLKTDDFVAMASERAALMTVFDATSEQVQPVKPGHVVLIRKDGRFEEMPFTKPLPLKQCTFERVYFSRGNDPDIYQERKRLGRNLAPRVIEALGDDLERAVFSYIPNTAEPAYLGLVEEIERLTHVQHAEELWQRVEAGTLSRTDLEHALSRRVRMEKVAHKDQRLRTFITHDSARRDLVSLVYDRTHGAVQPGSVLVVVDDSIVRGTTLRESIITMLAKLDPARIVMVSSAPPIMYPDCYGIDMSQLGRFIAFEAAVALLRDHGEEDELELVRRRCAEQAGRPTELLENMVRTMYDRFSLEELSAKIAQLIRAPNLDWRGRIDVVYQTVDGLRDAMPGFEGDWYFTGNYPTPGGYRVLNRAYLKWWAKDEGRAYEPDQKPAPEPVLPQLIHQKVR